MTSRNTIELIPNAARLVNSMRDVGYDFVHAVADIVDNSITANATTVDVQLHFDGADSWIRVSDNGTGMDGSTITEAMRFGSDRAYSLDDLGKFGLGLKTASLSQAATLTVASRTDRTRRRFEARRFDLAVVMQRNRWEIEILASKDRPDELIEPLDTHPGTVVLWTNLDRVLPYKITWGDRARQAMWALAERLENHLGMVFHRYLEGKAQRHRLTITVNGNKVEPWNPFGVGSESTEEIGIHEFGIVTPVAKGIVGFRGFVLPSKEEFSSPAAFDRLAGPRKWNDQQGFYIYRANRLIQSGGWSRMRANDEHTKLARASIDFYPDLDAAFGINIAKARVDLPTELRERLKDPVEKLVRRANARYRKKPVVRPAPSRPPAPTPAGPAKPPPKPDVPLVKASPTLAPEPTVAKPVDAPDIAAALRAAARAAGEEAALKRILAELMRIDDRAARVLTD